MNRIALRATLPGLSLEAVAAFDDAWIVLSGDNGAGKTTLLRAMAGLVPCRGQVRIGGETWQDDAAGIGVPPEARTIGFVWPRPVLLPWLDVAGNICLGCPQEDRAWFREVCEALMVTALLTRKPGALSTGEAQRVMLARAFCRRPKLLLLDEPLAAQAPRMRPGLIDALRMLHRRLGVPMVMVSHDRRDQALAEVRWHMCNGRLVTACDGTGNDHRREVA